MTYTLNYLVISSSYMCKMVARKIGQTAHESNFDGLCTLSANTFTKIVKSRE